MYKMLIYAHRCDFVDKYMGYSEDKTKAFLKEHRGRHIIIVDKVQKGDEDTFGREAMKAIDTYGRRYNCAITFQKSESYPQA